MGYTKQQAISIVTTCAKKYQENLVDKSLLFLCMNKHKNLSSIEFTFDASNFLHLTGLKLKTVTAKDGSKHKLSALEFYNKCLDNKLSVKDFDFSADGTTELKLDVLPLVINKWLSADTIGDFNSQTPQLYTEKLAGGVKACIGFVLSYPQTAPTNNSKGNLQTDISVDTTTEIASDGSSVNSESESHARYVPNTVLKVDIRDYITNPTRVIAVFRKCRKDTVYSELTYTAKKIDWETIKFPKELDYLKAFVTSV